MGASMSSFGIAISGLNAARMGLNVTGHNISNTGTPGYSRQQAIQKDAYSLNIGTTNVNTLQLGMGADVDEIRQMRDQFLDQNYRNQVGKANYHTPRYETGQEIERIFGELESQYSMHGVLSDFWDSVNELSIHPDGIETRATFIANCQSFINKINNIGERMINEQNVLNERVKETVNEINQQVAVIHDMNQKIRKAEAMGDNANDYRDQRNLAMDELSELVGANFKHDKYGSVVVLAGGFELLGNGIQKRLGLQYTQPDCLYVKPVLTESKEIIPFYSEAEIAANPALRTLELYPDLAHADIDPAWGEDTGLLKGLLTARGDGVATYVTNADDLENYVIPNVQKQFDTLVHNIVVMINDVFAPENHDYANAPVGLDGSQFVEIFVRNTSDSSAAALNRYDPVTGAYNAEDENSYYTMYTIGNIQLNPALLTADGYNKIATSFPAPTTEPMRGDNRTLLDILSRWKNENIDPNSENDFFVDNFYRDIISDIGGVTNEAKGFLERQVVLIDKIESDRQSIAGVSLDEEMTNMMKFQHAYNSSAKVLSVIDSMLDVIVNRLVR